MQYGRRSGRGSRSPASFPMAGSGATGARMQMGERSRVAVAEKTHEVTSKPAQVLVKSSHRQHIAGYRDMRTLLLGRVDLAELFRTPRSE